MIDEWDLSQTNMGRIRKREYNVAVLPIGSLEAHNLHLPLAADSLQVTHVARQACARAWTRSPSIACLPTITCSVDSNLMKFPLTVHIPPAVLEAYIRSIVESMRRHGIRKFVLLNGHGGNEFGPLMRQLSYDLDVFLFATNWYDVGSDKYAEIFSVAEDHAGQMETSVMLAICPELVELSQAVEPTVRPATLAAVRQRWVRTIRDFGRMTDVCATASPQGASAQRGQAYLDVVIPRIADFLVELAQRPIDEHFPF